MTTRDAPAFPTPLTDRPSPAGLTKREYVATHLAAALIADDTQHEMVPRVAVRLADALLAALAEAPVRPRG